MSRSLPNRSSPEFVAEMPDAASWLIEFDSRLTWRLASARVLFAAEANPSVLEPPEGGPGRLFPAGFGFLRSQIYGFATYLEPVLLALSPWLIGVEGVRSGGALVVLFGRALPGLRQAQAAEMLQMFRPLGFPGARPTLEFPEITRSQQESALRWWVDRLNHLFAMALDVTRYRDGDGYFQASGQMGVLLSLERLFASVQEVLIHVRRDEFARAAMFFDVLDVLEGLGYDSWAAMVTLRTVEGHLQMLRKELPPDAQAVLLPRCEAAVAALREVVAGFAATSAPDGKIRLPRKGGGEDMLAIDRAGAEFLRLTRNASHSYRERVRDPRDVALLAAHRTEIPETLADLAWLHLLRLMAQPRLPLTSGEKLAG